MLDDVRAFYVVCIFCVIGALRSISRHGSGLIVETRFPGGFFLEQEATSFQRSLSLFQFYFLHI